MSTSYEPDREQVERMVREWIDRVSIENSNLGDLDRIARAVLIEREARERGLRDAMTMARAEARRGGCSYSNNIFAILDRALAAHAALDAPPKEPTLAEAVDMLMQMHCSSGCGCEGCVAVRAALERAKASDTPEGRARERGGER